MKRNKKKEYIAFTQNLSTVIEAMTKRKLGGVNELATALGYPQTMLSTLLNLGKKKELKAMPRSWRLSLLLDIADYYGVSLSSLINQAETLKIK